MPNVPPFIFGMERQHFILNCIQFTPEASTSLPCPQSQCVWLSLETAVDCDVWIVSKYEGKQNIPPDTRRTKQLILRPSDTNVNRERAILQYPGHLHREILIFWQKSLWTIHTYHLVPFKLPKNVQRGPFQGLLVLKYFFQKISNFTNYALTPAF